jgi:hypothetical protein
MRGNAGLNVKVRASLLYVVVPATALALITMALQNDGFDVVVCLTIIMPSCIDHASNST